MGVGREGKGRKTGQRWGRETRRQDAVEGKRGKMKCQIQEVGTNVKEKREEKV